MCLRVEDGALNYRSYRLYFAVILSLVSGCVASTPQDLIISELSITPRKNVDQFIEVPFNDSWIIDDFLIIGFSTDTDLIQYAQQNDYPLTYDGLFCEDQATPVFSSGLFAENASLYTRRIETEDIDFSSVSTADGVRNYTYYVLVPMSFSQEQEIYGRPEREDAVFYKKYDLRSNPRDLCFKIGGYAYGFGFESNLVTLSANEIQLLANV